MSKEIPNVLIFGPPGSGKTVAATAPKNEKILHLCSDNSAIVLDMFDRPNVTRQRVEHWIDPGDGNFFNKQFEDGISSGKYTVIVVDNLSDLTELAVEEITTQGTIKNGMQMYGAINLAIRILARKAGDANIHVIFTAWEDEEQIIKPDGTQAVRKSPALRPKVMNAVVGKCAIVGRMTKALDSDGKMRWFLVTQESDTLFGCKDQLYGRKSCMPENLFVKPEIKK